MRLAPGDRVLTPTPPSPRRSRRLPAAVQAGIVAVVAVGLVLGLVVAPSALRAAASHPEAAPAPPPPGTFRATAEQWRSLSFAPARAMGFADLISTDGRIATDDDVSVQVTPPFSGRVVEVRVRAGDHVSKGQVLLTAQASEVAQARNDLAAAEAALETSRAQAATAAANASRQQALYKISGAALRDVQQASSDSETAQNQVRTNLAAVALVRQRLAVLQSATGPGALAAIKAPISGVVISRAVGPGQFLNATSNGATTPIFTISDVSRVWLVANVPETQAASLRLGDPVTVRVSGLPNRTFHARLDYVAPTLDPATRRLVVHATLANPDGLLKPETFADFALDRGPAEQALGVPSSAVIYEGDQARVWVAGAGRTLGLRQIKAGRTQAGEVEVLAGLQPGERVVDSGAIFIDRASHAD